MTPEPDSAPAKVPDATHFSLVPRRAARVSPLFPIPQILTSCGEFNLYKRQLPRNFHRMLRRHSLSIARRMMRMNSTAAPAGYKEDLSKGATFRFQDSLPQLPVPTLAETSKKYLRSVKALVTEESYQNTAKAVEAFIKPGGPGEVLQKRLQEYAAQDNVKNWLYEFWNETAYMGYRDPVVPYVSYFYSFKDDARYTPAQRASAIITSALKFKKLLDTKTLEPDYMRKEPMDMELFNFLFNNCRVPKPNVDENVGFSSAGNEFIIVIRRNRFYKLPYITKDGRQLTAGEFEQQLLKIYNDADLKGTAPNVGGLSSENRDKWAKMYKTLEGVSGKNKQILTDIQRSAFVVCLDFSHPETNLERTYQYWHGNGKNRFYDKPVQFVVNDNGTAGFMGEHSMMDGTQTHRLNDYVGDQIFNDKVELDFKSVNYSAEVDELSFDLNDQVKADVAEAEKDFWSEIQKHEVAVWAFDGYGKNQIKKFKCSPDAYIQMLLQLAYYKLYGKLRGVYEAATTRKFIQGRTETCRSVSVESKEFVESFWNPSSNPQDIANKFRKAVDSQVKYIADASVGKGVDRHLFGLKKMLKQGEPLPELYQDPVFAYSSTWYLSTSQLSSEFFNGYGWSQVIDEGFGCAYMINANNLHVNICSKHMGSHDLAEALEESAVKLAEILNQEAPKAKL